MGNYILSTFQELNFNLSLKEEMLIMDVIAIIHMFLENGIFWNWM